MRESLAREAARLNLERSPTKEAAKTDLPQKLPAVWTYGINDHIDVPAHLPVGFQPSGMLCADYRKLCDVVGVPAHPAIKAKHKSLPVAAPRRPSVFNPTVKAVEPVATGVQVEVPLLHARSTLFDRASIQLLSILLPVTTNMKGICFSDCRLDTEAVRTLRQGLVAGTSVESLQVEWNAFDMPLPMDESAAPSAEDDAAAAAIDGLEPYREDGLHFGACPLDAAGRSLEARERRRYHLQSQRTLRCFREWLESLHDGNLEPVWRTLAKAGVDFQQKLEAAEFNEVFGTHFGLYGQHVPEVFDVLDGPDYTGSQGFTRISLLKAALEALPEEVPGADTTDPTGLELACLLERECALESISFRSCSLTRLELGPIAAALAAKPWQLRCLNLWDNRICDRGAETLAAALESYRGLEYLGLGRNRISEVGLKHLCRPFEHRILHEEQSKEAMSHIKSQQEKVDAAVKAKAKKVPSKERQFREPVAHIDELEEKTPAGEGVEAVYVLRRPSELKSLVLSENPIRNDVVVEAIQPKGPRGVELVLRGTPAAAVLAVRRPDFHPKMLRALLTTGSASAGAPEGWTLRLL